MNTAIADTASDPSLIVRGLQRRSALISLAMLGVLGATRPALAQPATEAQVEPAQAAWRAMSRVGYGASPSLAAAVQAAPTAKHWALQQVDLAYAASLQPPVVAADLTDFNAPLPQLFAADRQERALRRQIRSDASAAAASRTQTPQAAADQRMAFSDTTSPEFFTRRLVQQTAAWRLTSCSLAEQENPLLARMTEFWFNHLNVFIGKGADRPYVGHYLIHVVRAHALGKFEDLLLASARHPAMLLYLDQAQSVAEGTVGGQGKTRGLNENYARELMELHTLGVNGGYTQTDVRELARVLTGWTIGPQEDSGFRFAPRLHDKGSKQVLGQTFPATRQSAGEQEGVQALRLLARHPATAQRISQRLARFFVSDNPPPALVAQLAQTFLSSQGDIRAVLNTLLNSTDFWAPEHQLFKTPLDFACSALTATQSAASPDRRALVLATGYLASAGQPLHGWQTPDGYAFDAATWLAPEALTRRADFALNLTRQLPALTFMRRYLSASTLDAIDHERPALQAGLMLASPDFMYK